jgi:D-alanyl-lipoteichoic acid acyltransferase DltB (MBOAT superfamily)
LQTVIQNIFSFDAANPISLISGYFLLAFTLFLFIYSIAYKDIELRKWTLILFNLLFYFKLTGFLAGIILLPAFLDYFIARRMQKIDSERNKTILLYVSICLSLGLLVYFKYTNFFIELINQLTGTSISVLKIIIPVGISFYVFRTISYVVDVYNEKIDAVDEFSDYLVYMTFFPLMISGPITRAEKFIPQLNQDSTVSKESVNSGLFYIVKGLIKKAIFADYLGIYVATIFAAPEGYSGIENIVAIVCFSIQLYLDFSGYTDIAYGIAKILGFDIGINFNQPFKAKSISDFWRRWHISLSDWLKDYIFSPLNFYFRKMKIWGAILAMFITFFICGIWHGTTWIFILFGITHGTVLCWELTKRNIVNLKDNQLIGWIYSPLSWFLTFSFVVITMMAMKVDTVSTAYGIIRKIWTKPGIENAYLFLKVQPAFTFMFILALILTFLPTQWKERIQQYYLNSSVLIKILLMIFLTQLAIELQNQNIIPFIYAQY